MSYTGNTGAWATMSADEELGYVYVPTEAPTNDLYGGHRPGNNLFAESLTKLRLKPTSGIVPTWWRNCSDVAASRQTQLR